jgi:ubiquinone/menaquinone biosynthesis C-methylase UbiE
MNPWLSIPFQDYEQHMSHHDVQQFQCLNSITKKKVTFYHPNSILIFGACTGNGFEHLGSANEIYAIDINDNYLQVCKKRYHYLGSKLKCICADVDKDIIPVSQHSIELVICHLFLEYVHWEKLLPKVRDLLSTAGIFNVVLQKEDKKNSFVSDTRINSLKLLSQFANIVEAKQIADSGCFELSSSDLYSMPNGKILESLDFCLKKTYTER